MSSPFELTQFSHPLQPRIYFPSSFVSLLWFLSSAPLHSWEVTSNTSQQHMLAGAGAKAAETARKGENPTKGQARPHMPQLSFPLGLRDRAAPVDHTGVVPTCINSIFLGGGVQKPSVPWAGWNLSAFLPVHRKSCGITYSVRALHSPGATQ